MNKGSVLNAVHWTIIVNIQYIVKWIESCLIDTSSYLYLRFDMNLWTLMTNECFDFDFAFYWTRQFDCAITALCHLYTFSSFWLCLESAIIDFPIYSMLASFRNYTINIEQLKWILMQSNEYYLFFFQNFLTQATNSQTNHWWNMYLLSSHEVISRTTSTHWIS